MYELDKDKFITYLSYLDEIESNAKPDGKIFECVTSLRHMIIELYITNLEASKHTQKETSIITSSD